MRDLELTPLNDLLDELSKRFDTVVFGGLRSLNKDTGNHYLWFTGDVWHAKALGFSLAQEVHLKTIADREQAEE